MTEKKFIKNQLVTYLFNFYSTGGRYRPNKTEMTIPTEKLEYWKWEFKTLFFLVRIIIKRGISSGYWK